MSANDPLATVERILPRRSPDVRAPVTAWTLPADSDVPGREGKHHEHAGNSSERKGAIIDLSQTSFPFAAKIAIDRRAA